MPYLYFPLGPLADSRNNRVRFVEDRGTGQRSDFIEGHGGVGGKLSQEDLLVGVGVIFEGGQQR
jgi:hypothetical protein